MKWALACVSRWNRSRSETDLHIKICAFVFLLLNESYVCARNTQGKHQKIMTIKFVTICVQWEHFKWHNHRGVRRNCAVSNWMSNLKAKKKPAQRTLKNDWCGKRSTGIHLFSFRCRASPSLQRKTRNVMTSKCVSILSLMSTLNFFHVEHTFYISYEMAMHMT